MHIYFLSFDENCAFTVSLIYPHLYLCYVIFTLYYLKIII